MRRRLVVALGATAAGAGGLLALTRAFRVIVAGRSMVPTLTPGDRLLAVRPRQLRRGDVVVVRIPGHSETAVKRILGLPGERVEIADGLVRAVVRGPRAGEPGPGEPGTWTLGADEYLVVGDNREESTDVRAFGPLRREDVLGKVVFRYRPRPGGVR
jgi:signal peptidase I